MISAIHDDRAFLPVSFEATAFLMAPSGARQECGGSEGWGVEHCRPDQRKSLPHVGVPTTFRMASAPTFLNGQRAYTTESTGHSPPSSHIDSEWEKNFTLTTVARVCWAPAG